MRVIQTLVWIVITAVLVAFVLLNLEHAPVNFWPLPDGSSLHVNWPVGFIALFFFFLGLAPMWLLHKAGKWRMKRKMSALENSVRIAAPAPLPTAPLEPASPEPEDKPL